MAQAPADTSARTALRQATDASHQRMHGLAPFAQIAAGTLPMKQYRQLLQSLFLFHAAVGQTARRGGWSLLSSSGQRLGMLRSDLAFLGAAAPEPDFSWQAGPREAALGALYAAEGSMMGGRVIARQLDYAFGSSQDGRRFFMGDKGDRANWLRLIGVLESTCQTSRELNAAIVGASRTFDWFERCITRECPSHCVGLVPPASCGAPKRLPSQRAPFHGFI